MPRPYQIIPKNNFPTEETYVNDNTVVSENYTTEASENSFLYVVSSPKGIDGKMQTIRGLSEFMNKIGLGPHSLYGQPLVSAYSVARTGRATLQILRVAAQDAKYACINVCAAYNVDADNTMTVRFYAKPATAPVSTLDDLEAAYIPSTEPDPNGYTEVKLFSVAALGRGTYGNNYQIRLSSLRSADRENDFKNYTFELWEANKQIELRESNHVCFSENAVIGTTSYYVDSVIGDPTSGSEYIKFVSYPEAFNELYDVYSRAVAAKNDSAEDGTVIETIEFDAMDFFGGENKYTKTALPLYTIDNVTEGTVNLYGVEGYPNVILAGGDDGALSDSNTAQARESALEALYTAAFSGEIDPMIKSKNKFPASIIADQNYSPAVKAVISALNTTRGDSIALFDAGTKITTQSSVITTCKEMFANITDTYEAVDAYCGKIRDPFNQKIITVTSTYALCLLYANQFYAVNGKHVPLADNQYGNLNDIFLTGTIYPVFDEDIHAEVMNDLIDERINFARNNSVGEINRATQTTRQSALSVLSELNNVFLLKDIKRAVERMCAANRYNFAEASDIARFNKNAELVVSQFSGQVAGLTAEFGQNAYESENSIVHLYVELICRQITKTTIIEIDVNRA